ncbi:TetR/AcrR family transcriptional regulator [Caulobacter sp. UNC279MFTsu5.1]|uniref:TetR/AcrR family transcriptional regulator n=1 Tax=Caulobacter sp. UNC279MFTsu5.1 TaxID=1502775 RepID=UPI0008E40ADC|nr:TetR/AcrR family transcriptional regulator [Caulobacter sp. UNC279MFTsu5.1]SFJ76368.1 transcriptional regulator, TetR family [Caulobacter sp. UNC279MFTsu5.1]
MGKAVGDRGGVVPLLAEAFRECGFEGASLSVISQRTGLGKGSLYNFFPGGKEEMGAAVLAAIDAWFEAEVFAPLRAAGDPRAAITAMRAAVDAYFRSGRRVCLVGAFALDNVRERFPGQVRDYFAAWRDALAGMLERGGVAAPEAREAAEDALIQVQGALVLCRALDDPEVFTAGLARMEQRLMTLL